MSNRRILVTGSGGFIGSHLVRHLTRQGYIVSEVDRITHAQRGLGRHATMDLNSAGAFETVLELAQPDRVIHLAAQVGRLFGEDDIRHTITSNAEMTAIVASACGARGVPLVYASTSEIYGDHREYDVYEGTPWKLPHNLYGLSKRWGEEVCRLYAPDGLLMLRFSMPYGPGAPPGRGRRALDNFLWQAIHGKPIPVHRGAKRSWCYITDTVAAIQLLMEESVEGAYNVGRDDDERTLLEIAERACALAGASTSLIQEVEPPAAQTVVKRLNTANLRSLGWEPRVEIAEGMYEVYEWILNFDADGKFVTRPAVTR